MDEKFTMIKLPKRPSYIAPDGSEIRLLADMNCGGLAHCTLPPQRISSAVKHKSVDEIWYFISGKGQVWRKQDREQKTKPVDVEAGTSLTIPVGTHFQFRNKGTVPLCFIIATIPPWPGPDEAVQVDGFWWKMHK